jgi:hypothetical protein
MKKNQSSKYRDSVPLEINKEKMNNDVSPTEQPTYLESQLAKEIMF